MSKEIMKSIIVYNDFGFQEYPLLDELILEDKIQFVLEKDTVYCHLEQGVCKLRLFQMTNINGLGKVMVFDDTRKYYKKRNTRNIIINDSSGDLVFANCRLCIEEKVIINPDNKILFINGNKTKFQVINFNPGDQIMIKDIIIINYDTQIMVCGNHNTYTCRLEVKRNEKPRDFPNYRRSPRIIQRVNEEKYTILTPPKQENISKGEVVIIIVTPLIAAASTIAASILMPRGIYVYLTLTTTVVTTAISIIKYRTDKRNLKKSNKAKADVYDTYLLKTRCTLENYKNKEIVSLNYHFPSMEYLENEIKVYSSRIYEKDMTDDDFLEIYVGSAKSRSSIDITLDIEELEIETSEQLEEAKSIKEMYQCIDNKPMTIDLKKSHIGLIGDKKEIHVQIKQMLTQVTFFHSYHDVEIIMIYNERYKETFDYSRWYPHMRISAINVSGNLCVEKVRAQVLTSVTQILKQRRERRQVKERYSRFAPHYIIFIDDYFLVMNHSILEYLQEETTGLGFTLILSANHKADLLENIKTVLIIEDLKTNRLLMREGKLVDKQLISPQINSVNLEKMARDLSVLNHQKGVQSQIPETVTFFELYNVKNPSELKVLEKWAENQSHMSLSVPLGVRGENDIVYLDLHEKAHGPHGLVAGTTGSGKSEIMQSYILSLAVNFHPHEVGFLLIDFKGGGMANLFKNLPHLLGSITNLDGIESMRALASIKSELKRRQRIFNEHGVNHIIKYNKLFKSGKAKEPLPNLFLISDEFAELKKEQPEFMSELVSVARIGRTLGVKLILATQKPTGVVDDQIWSNSKFKLALKVQNVADSKEVIKTPDAAYITQAGRAYLQVGNNEIYEVFQSAWSGATYCDHKEIKEVDDLVYRMNNIGQLELVNKDLSSRDNKDYYKVKTTQLDVIIDYIKEEYGSLNSMAVTKPWLPSLAHQIVSPHIPEHPGDVSKFANLDLRCPIGFIDIPEKQKQKDYALNFVEEGNLAIFASSGYGKSFTIGTIILSLAVKNSPELLNFYIVDLGNTSLIPYVNLPHTADYMTFDSNEKVSKLMKHIDEMIKIRKRMFAREMVQNYDTYNRMHQGEPLKAIVVCIDNYDVVKEMEVDLESFVLRLSRDGFGLGIYVIVTATTMNVIRYATMNNFKNRLAQYVYDNSEYHSVVGRPSYELPAIKGRALVKQENVNIMQVYSPFAFVDNIAFIRALKEYVRAIKAAYTGDIPKGIPILPEVFTSNQFSLYENESSNIRVKTGLCVTDVVIVDADISGSPYMIIGPQKCGKTNLLELYINQMIDNCINYIFDSSTMYLLKYTKTKNINYLSNEEELKGFIEILSKEVEKRKELFKQAMARKITSPEAFYASLHTFNIFIDDIDEFVVRVNVKNNRFLALFEEACRVGINIIATASTQKLKGYDDFTRFFKTAVNGMVLGNQGTTTVFPVASNKEYPIFGMGLLFNNGEYRRILIPKFITNKEVLS